MGWLAGERGWSSFKQGLGEIARSNEFPAFLLWPSWRAGSKVVLEVLLGGPGERVRLEAKPFLLASWYKGPWCLEREKVRGQL